MKVLFVAKTTAPWHNGVRMYWASDRLGYQSEIISIDAPVRRFRKQLTEYQPDWVIITGSRLDWNVYEICKEYAKVCVWCADCVDEGRLGQWKRLTGLLDCAFTPILTLPELLKERGITDNAAWMPQFWDQTYTRPFGHTTASEICHIRTPGDSLREKWEKGLSTYYKAKFVGGWKVPDAVRGNLAGNAYAASKIAISIPRKNKWVCDGYSDRIFNAIGCKSLFLQYDSPGLDRLFEVGKHFDIYDGTYKGLVDKINFYLDNDKLRSEIATAGQKHALKYHTVDVRVKEMWEHLCALQS